MKIQADRFSRFGDILYTDSENTISRKRFLKFRMPIKLSLNLFTNTQMSPKIFGRSVSKFPRIFLNMSINDLYAIIKTIFEVRKCT